VKNGPWCRIEVYVPSQMEEIYTLIRW